MQGFENLPKNPTSKEEDTRKKFRIAVVDNSSQVESAARDAADSKLTASEKESNAQGWKGKLKNIWKNNLAKPYYLQKETALAKKRISESGNVYINEGGREEDHAKERLATTERFLSEYDRTIHREAGEDRDILGKNEGEIAIQAKIKDLVMDYAEGKLTEEAFMEEKGRVFNELKDAKKDIITKGLMYSDNVLEIAKQIKQSMEHGESIDRLDLDFEVVVGRAKSGARTEAQYNSIDKLTAMVMDSKVGSLVNETTVASALSIVFAAGSVASKGLLNRNVAAVATFGGTALVGGGIAALRERKMLEDDRKQHFREMAQGKKFENSKSPRRQEMEKYRYDSRDANALYQNLDQSLYVYDEDGKQDLKQDMSVTELQVAFGQLAEMAARIDLSDGKKIDLVGYSDVKSIEQERLMLDIARGKAECDLMKCANSPAMQQVLNGKTVDEFLSSLTETRKKQLIEGDGGIEKQNALFKDFKTKATGKAFVKGVVTGLVVGAAVQELISFINPHQTGLVENFLTRDANGAVDANGVAVPEHYTPLEGARRWVMDKFTGTEFPRMDMQNSHEAIIGATHAKLPQGVDLVPNNHGSFTLMQDGEIINDKITVDGNGNMTQEAINRLHHQGIEIKSTGGVQTPQEYVQNNPDSTTHIHRDLWYDNNTPKPLFDKNELKLHWGGQGGSGIDSDGNYVFNVKHMMPDGSSHGEFSVDAQEAMKNGELRMVFSLSADSQSHVFNVSIDANGNAIIPADSEMGKMMFDNAGGHAEFLGKYAEVIQDMGASDEGIEHVRVLATHVGDGVDSVGAPMAVFEMPAPYEIDSPWLIPAVDRTPLEPIVTKEKRRELSLPIFDKDVNFGYGGYGNYGDGYGMGSNGEARIGDKNTKVNQYFSNLNDFKAKLPESEIIRLAKQDDQFETIAIKIDEMRNNRPAFLNIYEKYKKRYGGDTTEKQFENKLETTFLNMGRNVLLENASVGDAPFAKEFYEKSPVVNGIKKAEELVVLFDPPLGDTILDTPIITSLEKYLKIQGMDKDIVIVTKHTDLFEDFAKNNPKIKVIADGDSDVLRREFQEGKKRYIINSNKGFRNPDIFNLSENEFKDEKNVLNVHYSSWSLEQFPGKSQKGQDGTTIHYYPIPLRVMRNMELLLGTKIFDNIRDTKGFWPDIDKFNERSAKMRESLDVAENDSILSLSFGSSVMPKEYEPSKWVETITEYMKNAPKNLKIVVLRDLNAAKADKYQKEVIDKLDDGIKNRIRTCSLNLKDAALLLKMSKAFLSPDTGLGHLASSMGTPNVVLHINNPLLWSSSNTKRVIGLPGRRAYVQGERDYGEGWSRDNANSYLVKDRTGKMEGASKIEPAKVVKALEQVIHA